MFGIIIIFVAVLLANSTSPSMPPVTMAGNLIHEPAGMVAPASPSNDISIIWQQVQHHIASPSTGTLSSEILIAVLDTGIDTNHGDLAGKIAESINFSSSTTEKDINGHGTHVAGIIIANANNGVGIAGALPGAKLLNVKIAEDSGMVWPSNVAKGIIWATDRGARVINMSLTVPSRYQPLEEAIQYAWNHGVVLIAAAGNYVKTSMYPAACREVIAVAATTADGNIWSDSNDGDFVDAYAPGVSIRSTLPNNTYGTMSGSSMASAYVTCVAAWTLNQIPVSNTDGKLNNEIMALVKTLLCR
jgi:thermitase